LRGRGLGDRLTAKREGYVIKIAISTKAGDFPILSYETCKRIHELGGHIDIIGYKDLDYKELYDSMSKSGGHRAPDGWGFKQIYSDPHTINDACFYRHHYNDSNSDLGRLYRNDPALIRAIGELALEDFKIIGVPNGIDWVIGYRFILNDDEDNEYLFYEKFEIVTERHKEWS
jgi:hypothetical protein